MEIVRANHPNGKALKILAILASTDLLTRAYSLSFPSSSLAPSPSPSGAPTQCAGMYAASSRQELMEDLHLGYVLGPVLGKLQEGVEQHVFASLQNEHAAAMCENFPQKNPCCHDMQIQGKL